MSNNYLETLLEDKANEFAYDPEKIMTPMERVLTYQAYLAGCKFILSTTSVKKPNNKETKDN